MSASTQFSVGKDTSLDIIGPAGPLRFPILTGFDSKPSYKSIESDGLDGINRYEDLPAGWTGSIKLDRADASVDQFFAKKEADFYAGLSGTTVTITETIQEPDGSVSQYRYLGVSLKLDDSGNKSGDAKVQITIGWRASRRVRVS